MYRIASSNQIPPQQLNALEARMQKYYGGVADYSAFHTPSHHPLEWGQVALEVRKRLASNNLISILEFGAGRSGFPTWLREQFGAEFASSSPCITCQDVTATNESHLRQVADVVVIAPIQKGILPPASFDIIFSTHCYEHVARPEYLLHNLTDLLKPAGSLLLFSPRYDLPFYLSPSAGDLSVFPRLLLSFRLLAIRLGTRLRGVPSFVLDTRPACLDRPFRRDSDAIHWVSVHDLYLYARCSGLAISKLNVSHQAPFPSKQWLIDQFCKLAIRLQKP